MDEAKGIRALCGSFLAAVVAMTIAAGAQAARVEEFKLQTAQDLVDLCATPPTDPEYVAAIHFCEGYSVGAYAYYAAVTSGQAEAKYVCVSKPDPSRASVLQDFVEWAKGKPEVLKQPPVDALFRFLATRFPCKH